MPIYPKSLNPLIKMDAGPESYIYGYVVCTSENYASNCMDALIIDNVALF